MAKSRVRKKKRKNQTRTSATKVSRKKELNIKDEIKYIIRCAQNFETKIVSIKELILFCTETGDAWLLDSDENCALNLVKEGEEQEFTVFDTPSQFGIDWKYNYIIENEKFIFIDKTGIARTIIGYPTEGITEMINKSNYLNNPI